jgi:hypothetical protein
MQQSKKTNDNSCPMIRMFKWGSFFFTFSFHLLKIRKDLSIYYYISWYDRREHRKFTTVKKGCDTLLAVILFVIGVILIIIEMFTLTFVLLWIGIASIIASIVEYFNHQFFLTFGTFFISAIVLWLCTKRFAKRVSSSK